MFCPGAAFAAALEFDQPFGPILALVLILAGLPPCSAGVIAPERPAVLKNSSALPTIMVFSLFKKPAEKDAGA